jgi:hypothetical protein
MSVTKSWAYTTEFGFERITAWAITQERKKYGWQPLGKTYWSTHRPGQRKRLKQIQKDGTTFFAYIDPADSTESNGGGESLTHELFKEALSGLHGTQLKLSRDGEHDITITHGEMEKTISTTDATYRADVYWRFTSTTSLGLKWSDEVYVEICHTHPVEPDKQKNLRQARVPVVEILVPKTLEYAFEETTTESLEAAHINRIRNMLQKGFLAGKVISNPSSVAYLEQEVVQLQQALEQAQQTETAAKRTNTEVLLQLKTVSDHTTALRQNIIDLTQEKEDAARMVNDLIDQLRVEKRKVQTLTHSRDEANAQIAAQKKEIRLGNWLLWVAITLMAGVAGFFGYQNFVVLDQNQTTQAVPTNPPQQTAPPLNPNKTYKSQTSPRQRTQ